MTVAKVWDGTAWIPVVGAQGPIGPVGPQGPPAGPIFLRSAFGAAGAGSAGGGGFWNMESGSALAPGAAGVLGPTHFVWDPAGWPAAPAGKTMKWRVIIDIYTNNVSPGLAITAGWRRFTVGGGAGGVTFAFIASDTEARAITTAVPAGGSARAVADLDVPIGSMYAP